jgi:hypothetical protein
MPAPKKTSGDGEAISRKRTAQLLRQLRGISTELKMLKARAEAERQLELTQRRLRASKRRP